MCPQSSQGELTQLFPPPPGFRTTAVDAPLDSDAMTKGLGHDSCKG